MPLKTAEPLSCKNRHVRVGSRASFDAYGGDFRFTPGSRHSLALHQVTLRAIKRHDKTWSKGERPRKIENERNRRLRLRFDLNSTRIAGGSRREALKAARSEDLFSEARRTLVALLVLHRSFRVTTAQGSSHGPHSAISIYGLLINC